MFKTIVENNIAEIVEKKSKFIANIFYIESVLDAENKIKEIKKKYYDARHNCYAFSVLDNDTIINRSSDDGEPSGTAGAPMLNLLVKNNLVNVLVVVKRYFGGILLGTGGLVRAYTTATMNVIQKCDIVLQEKGEELKVEISYDEFEKFKYYCKINNINIINIDYGENVQVYIETNEQEKNKILQEKEKRKLQILDIFVIREKYIKKNTEK